MAVNHFDKASRYAAKLDPEAFLDWLMPGWRATVLVDGWLETRTIPFPGEVDRICDTVVKLVNLNTREEVWAVAIEFQTKPDANMFGRLLEYLGRFWIELRPTEAPQARYNVAGAVVNLTGIGRTSRTMSLQHTQVSTRLDVAEKNIAAESAGETLANVASGKWGLCLLPWIPLMQKGGSADIIEQWKLLAHQEPISKRRADYAGLALVFSELTGCQEIWTQALEGWNMELSIQVLKWQAEAEKRGKLEGKLEGKWEGRIEDILRALVRRFSKNIAPDLVDQIKSVKDMDVLDRLFDAAVTVASLDEFRENMVP